MKRGNISLDTMIRFLIGTLIFVLVASVLFGLYGVLFSEKQDPRDASFARMLAATDALLTTFERGHANPQPLPVSITSDQPFNVAFYPPDLAPAKCKGKSCLCMYYLVNGETKETCKTIETSDVCRIDTCGETLCPGPYNTFLLEKGDVAYLKITCTDHGSILTLEKNEII